MNGEDNLEVATSDFMKPQKRLLTPLFTKGVPPLPSEDERNAFPEKTANPLSRVFFWWLNPVMKTGYKRTLQPDDLFYLGDDFVVKPKADKFIEIFNRRLAKAKENHILQKCKERNESIDSSSVSKEEDIEDFIPPKAITALSLLETFKIRYFMACLLLTICNVAQTLNPLLTKKLIQFVERRAAGVESRVGPGVGYAIGASLLVLVIGIFVNHFFYNSMMCGAFSKAVLTKAMLDKSFKQNAESRSKYGAGKVTSMMGTDLARIDFAIGFQPFIITFPVPVIIAIAILIVNVGPSALVGVGLLLFFVFFMMWCAKQFFSYRVIANKFTDKRVSYIKEVLNNLKIIKFYSWEPPYHENISDVRYKEMKNILKMQVLRNILMALAMSMTTLSSMATFLTLYGAKNGKDDAASIFSSISLFNVLSQQVLMLPLALASGVDCMSGLIRVGRYLASSEIDPESNRIDADSEKIVEMDSNDLSIEVNNANFEWETFELQDEENEADLINLNKKYRKQLAREEKLKKKLSQNSSTENNEKLEESNYHADPEGKELKDSSSNDTSLEDSNFAGLNNIDLKIKKGEFVVITGLIGSGKSSLLLALSGFMKRTSGSVNVNGSLLLCGYPWIQNDTVKSNILFGEELDEAKYSEVVYACSLESDLEILPAGDATEIGERGITLSGGQKARINLARAVYNNKDIILLDDVLSAVDARVGKHIMNNCILGLLKDKTRILATHQLSLIGSADRVIFLNGDGSVSVGTVEELRENNFAFNNLMAFNSETKDEEEEKEEENEDEEQEAQEFESIKRQLSKIPTNKEKDEEAIHKDYNQNNTEDGKLMASEDRAINGIKLDVYKKYIHYGSGKIGSLVMCFAIVLAVVLATFCQLFTNTWLSFWTEKKFPGKSDGFYIGFYVMFAVLSGLLIMIEFIFFVLLTNTASKNLNILAVKKVLHAPMSFMDTTPMGRILNRFTKDTDALDNELGDQIRMLFFFFGNIAGVLILCVIYLPWFAIAIPFLVALFIGVANYYQASAREIKRLEALQRSHVYNNFNETLNGMNTIKAYKADHIYLRKNEFFLNKMNEAYYLTIGNQRWLAIHLDCLATIFALIIALLCVFRVFSIGPASVGLLLSYVLQIAGQLSMLIRTYTQVENEMNAVERMCSYAFDLPQEAPFKISETTPPPEWPEQGSIKFEDVSLAYRPGLPLVLKNLSLQVEPSQKIGICGRTGAGKSSIMTALYRLSELSTGKIEIDGIDISSLGLSSLRSKLSIIPQDPVLFQGTIRKNLDPFNEHPDDLLWDSLRRAGLIEEAKLKLVKRQNDESEEYHKFHLNQEVEDDGANFSLGERQLIAFARALVRDSKILILDEATSSVDYETDNKIQSTIVREFSKCTILCIAHRLKTILNYDKILVLDKGEIKEFETPWNLFNTEDSIFQQMCERSNITVEDFENLQRM